MQSVCFLYGGAGDTAVNRGQVPDVLRNDLVVLESGVLVTEINRHWRLSHQAALIPKQISYFDWWGSSYRKKASGFWMPGPEDLTPELEAFQGAKGHWPYLMDDEHTMRLLIQILRCAKIFPHQAGVILDDFQDVDWWNLTPEQRAIVWGGRHSSDAYFLGMMQYAEQLLGFMLPRLGQQIFVNGRYRHSASRLWESVGEWVTITELMHGGRSGDMVLVKGIAANREDWLTTSNSQYGGFPDGTSYRDVFLQVLEVAETMNLTVGLCLGERPPEGDSMATVHAYTDPKTWESM